MKANEIVTGKNSLTSKLNSVDELSIRLVIVEGLDLKKLSRTQKDKGYEMQGTECLIEVLEKKLRNWNEAVLKKNGLKTSTLDQNHEITA